MFVTFATAGKRRAFYTCCTSDRSSPRRYGAQHPICVHHFGSREEQVACEQVSRASSIDDGLATPLPRVLKRAEADHCGERTLARDVILAGS